MFTSRLKLTALFALAIVFPASALAYLGIQAIEDEGERALREQERVAYAFREQFDEMIARLIHALREAAKADGTDGYALPDSSSAAIAHMFVLDRRGRWVVPNIPETREAALSVDFRAAMAAAGRLEFAAQDLPRALAAYRGIAEQYEDRTEQAIVLNAIARCARKMGSDEVARQAYTAVLRDHPGAFDESGAHLATYAHVQKADIFLHSGRPHEALRTLGDWLQAIDQGIYPVYEGFSHYSNRAEEMAFSIESSGSDGDLSDPRSMAGDLRELANPCRR